jgi:hypothetical protein
MCALKNRIVGDGQGRGEMDGWSRAAAIDSRKNGVSFARHDEGDSSYHRTNSYVLRLLIAHHNGREDQSEARV